jgi:hypothetical protein
MEDNQLLIKEVIFPTKPPLDHDCCNFALSSSVGANLTITKNSTTTNNTQVWAMLGKQQDYWKPKGCFSLTWEFFTTTTSSFLEIG